MALDMLIVEGCACRSTVEGRIAAKLEPDTPATFGDSAGVALKDDKDGAGAGGESPWESTLPVMSQQHIVDEVMSDAMEEHAQQAEHGQHGQPDGPALPGPGPGQAGQPSLLPSAHLRSLAGQLPGGKPGAPAKPSLSADASSAATHGCGRRALPCPTTGVHAGSTNAPYKIFRAASALQCSCSCIDL